MQILGISYYIGMFRPIRVDHTNCLQVAIKTHSFSRLKANLSRLIRKSAGNEPAKRAMSTTLATQHPLLAAHHVLLAAQQHALVDAQ